MSRSEFRVQSSEFGVSRRNAGHRLPKLLTLNSELITLKALIVAVALLAACDRKPAPPFSEKDIPKPTPPPPEQVNNADIRAMFAAPRYRLPDFTLTERSGQPFTGAAMRGKIWVVDFFFASCGGTCPMLSTQMQRIQAATADLPSVNLLSISVEEKDTPEVLNAYAKKYAASERWSFLTGKKDDVFSLSAHGFKLALVEESAVYAKEKFIHATRLVLVDADGWIRGYYEGVGPEADKDHARLLDDIRRLAKTPARESK